jgi:putative molybdopterin biosynthesis protein
VADLLRIAKNTVYELVKRGELNHYNVGRKMRFTKSDVDRYISDSRRSTGGREHEPQPNPQAVSPTTEAGFIICGQDPLLDVLTGYLSQRTAPDRPALRSYIGSYRGLVALYHGEVQAATSHLWDGESGIYNVPFVRRLLPGQSTILIHLTARTQGFYVASGNPKGLKDWEDLRRSDLKIVNREKGAGSRVLLDERLKLMNIESTDLKGYNREELSHLSVASAVGRGEGDFGVGDSKAARQVSGLDFIPLQEERYDLVVRRQDMGLPIVKAIFEILKSTEFRSQFQHMYGYNIKGMGEVVAEI